MVRVPNGVVNGEVALNGEPVVHHSDGIEVLGRAQ